MAVKTLSVDGQLISAREGQTLLEAAREAGISIPTLCHLDGLNAVGACRLCLVEANGRLLPSCLTPVAEEMDVQTQTDRLQRYRKQIVELLFAERNHVCSVCVANGNCELQSLAMRLGVDHLRYEPQEPECEVDLSHERYGLDHNRCVLCTRCVRVCDEIEGAHTWDVAGRGTHCRVITDLHQPWGDASTCTSCGKCVMACPTGALFHRGSSVSENVHDRETLHALILAREEKQWLV
ncbi:bidirectional hydrogenase complex protein HoxU [Tautonia marina]|uniref:bidirectional hydrogenase complex protein HoxU n=1 Tax=Tautonia marina TaxID=2653855 RepID=UPI0012610CEB|nr:bidirectional hydrogenase complex protein HoxU [Tautonia marina]